VQILAGNLQANNASMSTRAQHDESDVPTIYGALYSSNEVGFTKGIYSIEPTDGATLSPVKQDNTISVRAGVYINGKYYAFEVVDAGTYQYRLTTYNAETWEISGTPITITGEENEIRSMAYNHVTGVTYAVAKGTDSYSTLSTIDLETGTVTNIAQLIDTNESLPVFARLRNSSALAVDANGVLYSMTDGGNILKVNQTSAAVTSVYNASLTIHPCSSAVFDHETNKFYISFTSPMSSGSGIYEVDLIGQTHSILTAFANKEQFNGIYIKPAAVKTPAAPIVYGIVIEAENNPSAVRSVYSMPTSDGTFNLVMEKDDMAVWDGVYANGKYYAYIYRGLTHANRLICELTTYNPETWDVIGTPIVSTDLELEDGIEFMTYDATTGLTYVTSRTTASRTRTLSTLNLETGKVTPIGEIEADAFEDFIPVMLAVDSKGEIYTMIGGDGTYSGYLFKVNKKTAKATPIAKTNLAVYSGGRLGAVIDQNTDKMYLSFYGSTGTSGLYEVNLSTAQPQLITTYPQRERVTGLFIKGEAGETGAPAGISDLSFTPDTPGALTGKISFTVPSQTNDGSSLSGTLNGKIMIGGQNPYYIFGLTPGNIYTSESLTVNEGGFIQFRVTLSNAAGESQEASYQVFIGKDTPSPVTNVVLSLNGESKPEITWNAPTTTVNGGFFDIANLKYEVKRNPDNNVVATGITTLSVVDNSLPSTMAPYSYSVTPYIEALYGNSETSNTIILGDPFTVPYTETFTDNSFLLWTEIDNDGDGNTWTYSAKGAMSSAAPYSGSADVNDWLLSPPIVLESGVAYKLNYHVQTSNYYREERLKVSYGKSLIPGEQSVIEDIPSLKGWDAQDFGFDYTNNIVIPEGNGGNYYIGFNAYSEKGNASIYVNNITIEVLAAKGSPNVATDLNLAYGSGGALSSTISFKAPAIEIGGNALTDLTEINIYKGKETTPIHTFTSPTIGSELSWTDNAATAGFNAYRIVAENSYGIGLPVIDSVFVGLDIPAVVTDLILVKQGNDAKISWTAPSAGVNNGYVDASAITYKIVRNDGTVLETAYVGTTYTDNTLDEEVQATVSYTISASNTKGLGGAATSNEIKFGNAYTVPFSESFAGMSYAKSGWIYNNISASGFSDAWVLASAAIMDANLTPQDEDGGMMLFNSYDLRAASKAQMISPVIDLSAVANPVLKFWFFHGSPTDSDGVYLVLHASVNNGGMVKMDTDTIHYNTTGKEGWTLYEVPLTAYQGATDFMVGFEGYSTYNWSKESAIDNIIIENQAQKDLQVISLASPSRIYAGTSNKFTATIKNSGVDAITDYEVTVYSNGAIVATEQGANIASGAEQTITINVQAMFSDIGSTNEYYCEVIVTGDEVSENNTSEKAYIDVFASAYQPAAELDAEELDGIVTLSWTAPVDSKKPVELTDDFESYTTFIIDNVGDWTMVDKDGIATHYDADLFLVPVANLGAPMAYQVFDYVKANAGGSPGYASYSGSQSLISYTTTTNTPNNDWLISPEILGVAQTISFYARTVNQASTNLERFIVYYSTTDKDTDSFIQVSEENHVEAPTAWTKFSFEIPAGAKYFAIRCVSSNALAMLIDDITYLKAGESVSVSGYNVYRNDVKINSAVVTTNSYTDNSPEEGNNVYHVTAVYTTEESDLSNSATIYYESGNGIGSSVNDNIKVYAGKGVIAIKEANELPISIVTIDGLRVHDQTGTGNDLISVNQGIYIVKAGSKIVKVIVK